MRFTFSDVLFFSPCWIICKDDYGLVLLWEKPKDQQKAQLFFFKKRKEKKSQHTLTEADTVLNKKVVKVAWFHMLFLSSHHKIE